MLGVGDTSASVLGSSGGGGTGGDVAAAAATATVSSSGARDESSEAAATRLGSNGNNNDNSNSGEDDRGDRCFGGNRWPRQETLALLKIRSEMDATFRDASVKGPVWEEVSSKLAELGYHRIAKKCKEKFENVYKYHKRTRDGRTGKSDGKTYQFFDQLEALENHPSIQSPVAAEPSPPPQLQPQAQTAIPAANPPSLSHVTIPSTTLTSLPQNIVLPNINLTATNSKIQPPPTAANPIIPSFPIILRDLMSNSTSSSTFSDLKLQDRRKRKRKWMDFSERLMKEIIQKLEELQKKFLEAIEKGEQERMVREEAWRMQEMARINRELEILAHERSITAAKDEAVMAFLQKLSEQQIPGQAQNNSLPSQQTQPPPQASPQPVSAAATAAAAAAAAVPAPAPPLVPLPVVNLDVSKSGNGDQSYRPSSSRWPNVEVQALIKLRTSLDAKYQDSGLKGPLWEEISAAMKKLGYNRNAKRCKEKWENINKYFKKVKESNKKRPEDSKTCTYFHQLDALYREKNKHDSPSISNQLKPENSVPLMVRPEQQWPPPPSEQDQHQHDHVMEDMESDDQNKDEDDNDGDDEDEDEGGGFEIVASEPVSMTTECRKQTC